MGPPVTGCIARVEPTQKHRQFVQEVQPRWVMMKLHHARRLVENKEFTADSWAGEETDVITTSTINDALLDRLSWTEERDAIRAFKPAYHIPTDVSVYQSQSLNDRVECIENHLTGVAYMQSELHDLPTRVIPLFKGYTHGERELCLAAADALGVEMVALYATRYFTGNAGKAHNDLFRNLRRYTNHDMLPTLIIGLLAPDYLEKIPDYVVAASGQHQWRKRCAPVEKSVEQQRAAFRTLSKEVASALSVSPPEYELKPVPPETDLSRVETNSD